MHINKINYTSENHKIYSIHLKRTVIFDCYLPKNFSHSELYNLLLINDGQDLLKMNFNDIINKLYNNNIMHPLFFIGIHCSGDRRNEYGTAQKTDYNGRGYKAKHYNKFILDELLPFIRKVYDAKDFKDKNFLGFSLGGLSALDMVWHYPGLFSKVGVFSGSLWWRDKDQNDADFDEEKNRIMHQLIKQGNYCPWLKFYFEIGTKDETADRNNNGVIDAIDDTVSLIDELVSKGYSKEDDICYIELKDGHHDIQTWERNMPHFLKWGWKLDDNLMD